MALRDSQRLCRHLFSATTLRRHDSTVSYLVCHPLRCWCSFELCLCLCNTVLLIRFHLFASAFKSYAVCTSRYKHLQPQYIQHACAVWQPTSSVKCSVILHISSHRSLSEFFLWGTVFFWDGDNKRLPRKPMGKKDIPTHLGTWYSGYPIMELLIIHSFSV